MNNIIKKYQKELNDTNIKLKELKRIEKEKYESYSVANSKLWEAFKGKGAPSGENAGIYNNLKQQFNIEELQNEWHKTANDVKYLERIEHLQLNNYKLAVFEECLPLIQEVIDEFISKQMGAKTREKLKNKINEKIAPYEVSINYCYENLSIVEKMVNDNGYTYYRDIATNIYNLFVLVDNNLRVSPYAISGGGIHHEYFKNYENIIKIEDVLKTRIQKLSTELCATIKDYESVGLNEYNYHELYSSALSEAK